MDEVKQDNEIISQFNVFLVSVNAFEMEKLVVEPEFHYIDL